MTEIFLSIPNHDGYAITPEGEIYSFWKQFGQRTRLMPEPVKKMRQFMDPYGYLKISLKLNNTKRQVLREVHQIVLEAFGYPRPSAFHVVRHKNGIRHDNRLENLCWGTPKDNGEDCVRHGTKSGPNNLFARFTSEEVRTIRTSPESNRALADRFQVGISCVWAVRVGKTYKNVT